MSINKATLIGNVGKDPDVRDVNGVAVATFTLATTKRAYTKKDGTQVPEKTEWHNIVCWRGLAEIVRKYVTKDTKLYIEGEICYRSYDDKEGNKRYVTEIMANELELLSSKADGAQTTYQQPAQYQQQQPRMAVIDPFANAPKVSPQQPAAPADKLPF